MSTVLLDTNIVSFVVKNDTRTAAYAPLLEGNRLAISFVTVAELFEWASIRKWGSRRLDLLDTMLSDYLVIPVDIETCRLWGVLRARRRSLGAPLSSQDAWIAATAIQHSLPLVTHNAKDFRLISELDVRSASLS